MGSASKRLARKNRLDKTNANRWPIGISSNLDNSDPPTAVSMRTNIQDEPWGYGTSMKMRIMQIPNLEVHKDQLLFLSMKFQEFHRFPKGKLIVAVRARSKRLAPTKLAT